MKRITGGKKQRPVIRHENPNLGAGAGVAYGTIVVPRHNTFPAPAPDSTPDAPPIPDQPVQPDASSAQAPPVSRVRPPRLSRVMKMPDVDPYAGMAGSVSTPPSTLDAAVPDSTPTPPVAPSPATHVPNVAVSIAPPPPSTLPPLVREAPLPSRPPPIQSRAPERQDASSQPPVAESLRLGSLTQEREIAEARRKQKLRLLRSAERERHLSHAPRVMHPQPSRPVEAYVDARDPPHFQGLHAVLRKIKTEWGFLLDTDFNPVRLSMALLPHGPLRGSMSDFSSLAGLIETSLQSTVGDHFHSFASAIHVNHGMISSLSASQDGVSAARQQLQSARDALGTRRADLVQMWQRLQSVKEAMRILALLEQLRDVPDELESLMTEKRFLEATHLLMRSLRLIQREDLAELGATADLRAYLRAQEHSLLDILIDEVQSHLYLKSYWCDVRWQSYMPGQDTLPDMVLGAHSSDARPWTTLPQFLDALHSRVAKDDAASPRAMRSRASEEDSFLYLEMLLESLAQLGKMGYALDTIAQMLPTELHQLVDATIDQVEARYAAQNTSTSVRLETVLFAPHATHSVLDEGRTHRTFSLRGLPDARTSANAEIAALQRDAEILRDLFWTLCSKLEAVLAAHRAVQEVARALLVRTNHDDAGAADRANADMGIAALSGVWGAVEYEIRMLLLDYLAEDSERSTVSQHVPSLDAVLRMTRFERERNVLFRLTPAHRMPSVAASADRVDEALDVYVPGLMGKETGLPFVMEPRAHADEYLGAGHRRIVKPLSFTASVLLPPTLQLVVRAEQIWPADADQGADFGAFLRDFVRGRFLPLLGQQVRTLVQNASSAPDAFHAEPAARIGVARAVVRSSVQLVALMDSLYSMQQAAPFDQAGFTNMIILAFLVYYEACNARFKRLVSQDGDSPDGPYMLAAVWTQRPELYACLATAMDAPPSSTRAADAYRAEARTEMRLAEGQAPRRADLLTSRKRHMSLGTLHHSLDWLGTHMAPFHAPDSGAEPLPVSPEAQKLWQDVPSMYAVLAKCVLMTLRVELRLKTLYYLREAIRGTYICDALSMEPDVHVVELTTELSACHEVYRETMLPQHHAYVFGGLDVLMDTLMTEAVLHVRAINRFGVTKMLRNLLSVQQNLKNIVDEPRRIHLDRSRRLWELLAHEPESWLPDAPATYSAAEYLAVVRLSLGWGVDHAPIPLAGTTQHGVSDERFRACVHTLDAALKRAAAAT